MDFLDNIFSPIIPLIDTESIERFMAEIAEIDKITDFVSLEKLTQEFTLTFFKFYEQIGLVELNISLDNDLILESE